MVKRKTDVNSKASRLCGVLNIQRMVFCCIKVFCVLEDNVIESGSYILLIFAYTD